MEKRWWLAGACLLILTAVFVSVQGLATMGGTKTKTADAVPSLQGNGGVQAVSYGDQSQSGSVLVIPPRSGWEEDPPQEGMPSDEGRLPDVQADDPGNFPGQEEMNQEEPYEVMPPDEEYLDSMPPEEDQSFE